jgi:hypothetical protein
MRLEARKLRENIHNGQWSSTDQKRIEAFETWCWRRDGKGENRGGIQKDWSLMEHHMPKKNKIGWQRNETQLHGKYNGRKK